MRGLKTIWRGWQVDTLTHFMNRKSTTTHPFTRLHFIVYYPVSHVTYFRFTCYITTHITTHTLLPYRVSQTGLRDCVKWTQQAEQEQGFFYDLVVKLREDTLAFDNWIFFKGPLQGALTSAYIGAYRGVNDHNLVLDRKYADVLFRGIIEDYYFKGSNRHQMWNNTESRIFAVASEHNVTIRTTSMCEMPLIPLRNAWNKSHWLIHPQYSKLYQTTCNQGDEDWLGCQCKYNPVWMQLFNDSVIPFDWP